MQTQIRVLLKKQSDQGLLCLYSDKHFVNTSPDDIHFIFRIEKSVRNFRPFTVLLKLHDTQDTLWNHINLYMGCLAVFSVCWCQIVFDDTFR